MKKDQLLQYVGNTAQIGGSRHYLLSDGRGRDMRAIDVNTGSGLNYTILPDRGMDISLASFRGNNLVYISCNGETHPAFFEPSGFGWLNTFTGGLLTTCGLTYLGAPVKDGDEELGLHGRYSTIPARQVADLSEWVGDEYHIRLRGTIEEGRIFGHRIRLEREISSIVGQNTIRIRDIVINFGYKASPYTILYHMNLGYPLLSEFSELIVDPVITVPATPFAAEGINDFRRFIKPQANCQEQVYFHSVKSDNKGKAHAALLNRKLGISLKINFDAEQLPYLTEWKMMGMGEYVLGLEPCNVPAKNRVTLKEEKILPYIKAGETITNNIEVELTDL
ncbi:MAG: aldose 1-epimerase family protein [Bacteroidales bacterium]|nr:aldose 1-epimerase family protein [Bacteroidales bacterium]